ncbi:MAG: L,D-transpeptidase [Paracoccaceae bacterium]
MTADTPTGLNRRSFLAAGAAGALVLPSAVLAQDAATDFINPTLGPTSGGVRNNISSFRMLNWQDYFDNTRNGVILSDITSRALHFWSEDQSVYRLYPTSVPLSDDLTRKGRTEVIQKVENPTWRPTDAMKLRHPEWPDVVEGGAADNPLGVRALYLGWPAYRIHGTHDTRKIGRKSSSGCVGLYNEHILELYEYARVGTQVLLI